MHLPSLFNATVLAEKSILINSRSFLRYRLLIIRTLLQYVVIIFYDLGVLRQLLNMPVMSQFTQRNIHLVFIPIPGTELLEPWIS